MSICHSDIKKPTIKDQGTGWKLMFSAVIPGYYLWITGPNLQDWPRLYDGFPKYKTEELCRLKGASDRHKQFVNAVKTMFGGKIVQ